MMANNHSSHDLEMLSSRTLDLDIKRVIQSQLMVAELVQALVALVMELELAVWVMELELEEQRLN